MWERNFHPGQVGGWHFLLATYLEAGAFGGRHARPRLPQAASDSTRLLSEQASWNLTQYLEIPLFRLQTSCGCTNQSGVDTYPSVRGIM